jgi:hypothetical protein
MITIDQAIETLKAYRAENSYRFKQFNIYNDSGEILIPHGEMYVTLNVEWLLTNDSKEDDVGFWNKCELNTKVWWASWGSVNLTKAGQFQTALAEALRVAEEIKATLPGEAWICVETHEAKEARLKARELDRAKVAVMDLIVSSGITKGMRVGKVKEVADSAVNFTLTPLDFNFNDFGKTFTVKVEDKLIYIERIA